jgi:hypothetical protein
MALHQLREHSVWLDVHTDTQQHIDVLERNALRMRGGQRMQHSQRRLARPRISDTREIFLEIIRLHTQSIARTSKLGSSQLTELPQPATPDLTARRGEPNRSDGC